MTTTKPKPIWGFYRPHKRVVEDGRVVHPVTGELSYPPSRTKQSAMAECDINNIIRQFKSTGQITHINAQMQQGAYIDLPDDLDFQLSLETVRQGENAFMTLPAKTRQRFDNDPAKFLQFMADPANQDEMIKLGLAKDTRPAPESEPTSKAEKITPEGGAGGTPPA